MKGILNRKLIASLLGLAAVALLVVALSATSGNSTSDTGQADQTKAALAADGAAASQFAVLEPSAPVSENEIPAEVASVLKELPAGDGQGKGVATALGIVPGGSDSSKVVVAEVSGSLCLLAAGKDYQGAAVGSCFSITAAEAGKAYVAVQGVSPGEVRVLGLVPDGVEKVTFVSGANGAADVSAPVQSNVYQADVSKEPTTVTGQGASGDVLFRTEMPLAANGG